MRIERVVANSDAHSTIFYNEALAAVAYHTYRETAEKSSCNTATSHIVALRGNLPAPASWRLGFGSDPGWKEGHGGGGAGMHSSNITFCGDILTVLPRRELASVDVVVPHAASKSLRRFTSKAGGRRRGPNKPIGNGAGRIRQAILHSSLAAWRRTSTWGGVGVVREPPWGHRC